MGKLDSQGVETGVLWETYECRFTVVGVALVVLIVLVIVYIMYNS